MATSLCLASLTVPGAVYVIWIIVLIVAIVVILPVTLYLLQRTLTAARGIERYFDEMHDAGIGIAGNTEHIRALDDTIAVATAILAAAGSIKAHTATIGAALSARASVEGAETGIRERQVE